MRFVWTEVPGGWKIPGESRKHTPMKASSLPIAKPDAAQLERAITHLFGLIDAKSISGEEAPAIAEAERIAQDLGLPSERMPVAEGR